MQFICVTCGTQHAESADPPAHCAICEDERQYVGLDGQKWTTLDELRRGHANEVIAAEPGLHEIHTEPQFGIGQRAFLLRTPMATCFGIVCRCSMTRLWT